MVQIDFQKNAGRMTAEMLQELHMVKVCHVQIIFSLSISEMSSKFALLQSLADLKVYHQLIN